MISLVTILALIRHAEHPTENGIGDLSREGLGEKLPLFRVLLPSTPHLNLGGGLAPAAAFRPALGATCRTL